MFSSPKPNAIKDWTCILQSTQEFEVNLAHNFLKDHTIPSQILSKRDTAYSLVVGEMALMYLYVPNEYAEQATDLLASIPEANRSHLVDPEKVRPLNEKLDQLASEEDYLAAQELVQIAQKQHIDLSRLQEFTSGQQTPFWKKLLLSPFILLGFLNFRLAYIPVDHLIRNTIKDHAFDASIKFLVTVFLFPLSLSLISIVLWVAGVSFNMLLIYWLASFFSLFGFKEWVNSHKQRAHNQKWSEFAANNPDMHTEMIEKLNQLSLLKKKLYT